jgi:hypothetical protein
MAAADRVLKPAAGAWLLPPACPAQVAGQSKCGKKALPGLLVARAQVDSLATDGGQR